LTKSELERFNKRIKPVIAESCVNMAGTEPVMGV